MTSYSIWYDLVPRARHIVWKGSFHSAQGKVTGEARSIASLEQPRTAWRLHHVLPSMAPGSHHIKHAD